MSTKSPISSTSQTRGEKRSTTGPDWTRFDFPCRNVWRRTMKDSLSPYIDRFLTMVAVERGLAKNTVDAYSGDLAQFAEFLAARGISSWNDTAAPDFRSYLSSMRRKGLGARSIARHVVTLRRFYAFLQNEGVIANNPMPSFDPMAGARKLPQTLSA